jgi:peptidoglycan hydrolase-like protein with peptidoglycan-binding domain
MKSPKSSAPPFPPDNNDWPSASTHDIMLVQDAMKVMGLYQGSIDGLAGTETLRAVRAYKKSINLAPNNSLTDEFIEHIRTQT